MKDLITKLEAEWSLDSGFMGLLRQGEFSRDSFDRLLVLLQSISLDDRELINSRLVSLLWYRPTFMSWQKEIVIENGFDELRFENAISEITNQLEEILGIP